MDSKFNFVFEETTEEDKKFIRKFHLSKVYHLGPVYNLGEWTADRDKGMFLIYNASPGSLVL